MPDPDTVATWRSFLVAQRHLVGVLDAELQAGAGIPLEHYDVLYQLSAASGHRLPMGELAGRLLVARSTCTRLVDRLAALGLVERQPDPADRRVVWVGLSPEGQRLQRRAGRTHLAGIEAHFGGKLSPDDLSCLARALGRLLDQP